MTVFDFKKLSEYREHNQLEAKSAKGGFPGSFWETGGNEQDVAAMLELYAVGNHDTQNSNHDTQNGAHDTQNSYHDTQNSNHDTKNVQDLIKKNPKISKKELSEILGVSVSTIGRRTKQLNFTWIGPSRVGHWEWSKDNS